MNYELLAALAAAGVALFQFGVKLGQDGAKLRRNQTSAAAGILDKIVRDPMSSIALQLLDFPPRMYDVPGVGNRPLTSSNVTEALQPNAESSKEEHLFIRDAFDKLFFETDQIVALMKVHYLDWEDVKLLFGYYIANMRTSRFRTAIEEYTKNFGYPNTRVLIADEKRFELPADAAAPAYRS
ncbi:MAG TPA: hypothetical protein VK669_04420 [Candidatus Limnocylindrales bacterium]|nr:hypothetical protein [Candidatus Limnocylindrales bacterium]